MFFSKVSLSVAAAGDNETYIDRSHFKVFTPVVSLFSIVMRGEFSRRSVKKKTGAEVFSEA